MTIDEARHEADLLQVELTRFVNERTLEFVKKTGVNLRLALVETGTRYLPQNQRTCTEYVVDVDARI